MEMELYITVGIIAVGVFLFIKDYFSIDTTSLLIMATFIVTGVLSPEDGFSGFIHPATLTVGCMFVISAAIFKTGIIDGFSGYIVKLAKIHYLVALVVFTLSTALFSAFINDTAVVAIMIPLALMVSNETGISSARLLIPISFAACFGGAATLIGTGTNILVSSYAEKSGLGGFGMFEFSLAALVLAAVGMAYMFIVAPFLLPKHKKGEKEKTLVQEAVKYLTELTLLPGSEDVNKRVLDSELYHRFKAHVLVIKRDSRLMENVSPETVLQSGDVLQVLIHPEKLVLLQQSKGVSLNGQERPLPTEEVLPNSDSVNTEKKDDSKEVVTRQIYEVLIPIGSDLARNTVKELKFRQVYGASVLAIRHRGKTIVNELNETKLLEGDLLLIHASEQTLSELVHQKKVYLLSQHDQPKINYKKAMITVLIAAGVVTVAALNISSILISGMVGCLLLITTSMIKPEEAYQAIDWKVIFMMAGVLSMGMALENTGGAELIATTIHNNIGKFDPRITLSLVFLVTFLSTNILSSRAAAALMAPIVVGLSSALQVSDRPFLVAVMFACAFTFMTPVANPTNTMVYAPGNYSFTDFLKVGTPLNIIIWIVASLTIPLFFPF